MKNILKLILVLLFTSFVVTACNDDEGNYSYLSEDELKSQIIQIDTTGMGADRLVFTGRYNVGDIIKMSPKVKYPYQEDLKYSWIVYPYPYSPVEVGNTSMYPKPDTISHDLDIEWTVNLQPGSYTSHLIVEDVKRGLSASMGMGIYFTINKPGSRSGVFVLSEYNGNTDIDYYSSALCLIYEGDAFIPNYYSKELGHGMLPGKPKNIYEGSDYFYVITEDNAYRLNYAGLELMETFNDMFYQTPNFNPQTMHFMNNCEFLVNDGKLHVLYVDKANDRKFSAPISGDYIAGNYLSNQTRASWRPLSGAINSDQVIFDEKNLKFRPYFPQAVEVGGFRTTSADAFADANKLPAKPIAIQGGEGGKTYAIVPVDGVPYLYIFNFYNVIDDGDLSADGANSIIDLSGCEDIMNLKYFAANNNGSAFYYATDKAIYSFTPSSGQKNSVNIYTCAVGEEVTCLSVFYGTKGGGFPTAGLAVWAGIWEDGKQEGKLLEWEVDANNGVPQLLWGPMFGSQHELMHVTTGFGKIKAISAN